LRFARYETRGTIASIPRRRRAENSALGALDLAVMRRAERDVDVDARAVIAAADPVDLEAERAGAAFDAADVAVSLQSFAA
jgi:hypothetical protein